MVGGGGFVLPSWWGVDLRLAFWEWVEVEGFGVVDFVDWFEGEVVVGGRFCDLVRDVGGVVRVRPKRGLGRVVCSWVCVPGGVLVDDFLLSRGGGF